MIQHPGLAHGTQRGGSTRHDSPGVNPGTAQRGAAFGRPAEAQQALGQAKWASLRRARARERTIYDCGGDSEGVGLKNNNQSRTKANVEEDEAEKTTTTT